MPANVVGLHQMHPPGCQCGCGGNWGCDSPEWGSDLMQCWNQINQLKCLIKQILDEVGGPVRTGPIQGVIDGSDAKPGQVGEFLASQTTTNWSLAANDQQSQNISTMVVPPGDWDIMVQLQILLSVTGMEYFINPAPTGLSNPAQMAAGGVVGMFGDASFGIYAPSSRGRLSISVPTLLPFTVGLWNSEATASTGTTNLYVTARRMR